MQTPLRTLWLILDYIEIKTDCWSRGTTEPSEHFLSYWIRMGATTQCSWTQTRGDVIFVVKEYRKYKLCWWLGNNKFSFVWFSFWVYLRRQNLKLFTAVKVAHKCKVFEWRAFLLLMSAQTASHKSSTSTSCSFIIPCGTWSINILDLVSNNLMYDCR